jgi:hypothetical protein
LIQIEPSTKGLEFEPFGNWFKLTQVVADENLLYFYLHLRDNFAQWKEFKGEVQLADILSVGSNKI